MKWNKIYFLDILWLSFFIYLNFAQPLFADDWYRGHLAALYNGTILDHLINDYLTWTGRMSAQILVYPFQQPNFMGNFSSGLWAGCQKKKYF